MHSNLLQYSCFPVYRGSARVLVGRHGGLVNTIDHSLRGGGWAMFVVWL